MSRAALPGVVHLPLGLAFMLAVLASSPASAGVHGESLTTNKMPAASLVQNAFPRFDQRGTEIAGTVRSGSAMGLQLGANPFGEGWNRGAVLGEVRLATGTYAPFEVDLSFPAEIPWVIGRTYNARQSSGGSHHASNGYQGRNWFQTSQPELVYYDDTSGADDDIIYLVYGADRFAEYEKEEGGSSDEFMGVNGASGVIQYIAGTPDVYVLHDPSGIEVTFFGDDTSGDDGDWQIWKIEDQAGNVSFVGDASSASDAVTNGFDSSGRIIVAYDSAGRRFTYTYATLDSVVRLTKVLVEIDDGDMTWETAGGDEIEVGRVEYEYYGETLNLPLGTTHGDAGCLGIARTVLPLSITVDGGITDTDESESEVRLTYYRYWTGAYNGSTNRGHASSLKYVIDPEGIRRFDWAGDGSFDNDFLAADSVDLRAYAAAFFEYDSSRRIDKVWFNGDCGCSGGSNGTYELAYTDAGGYSTEIANTSYSASWGQRTVVNQPDTGWVSQYFDETGQALTRVFTEGDPSGSPSGTWVHGAARDTATNYEGQLLTLYSPASSTGYTHSTGTPAYSTTAGLVTYFERNTAGAPIAVNWSAGYKASLGDRSRAQTIVYGTNNQTIGSQSVTRLYAASRYAYPSVVAASASAESSASVMGLTAESGGSVPLIPTVVETDLPVITTGENGSNAAEDRFLYRRTDGLVAYTRNTQDRYNYSYFNNGVLVRRVMDADAETTGQYDSASEPGDFSITLPSDGLHLVTSYTHDLRGRVRTTTMPSGRVMLTYYTRLEDGRLVTLGVPSYVDTTTDVFYGPVSYTVSNLAGRVEASGVIAISGGSTTTDIATWIDETDDNHITAVDVGTLSRLTENVYDEAGTRLESSRVCIAIGGPTYDTTTYGYDDMGRRIKTVDPTGTISRVAYDVRGNVTATSIGTDDGIPGNMVTTEIRAYDGGSSGGNNHLTSITRRVQASSTDERVTTYIHDTRGRVIVATNTQSPHSVTAYDERGRVTASAMYSSTGGLTASAVPTTVTNRLSYSTTVYDLLNRPFDTRNYRVNQSSGAVEQESSNDVCIRSLTWYDSEGRVIKTVGGAIQKTEYDPVGRALRRFTIADTNDSVYTDADDVSGDTVVEESRTVYDTANGLVLATGTIQRNFDQTGQGALDSNADADPLMWTSANITGRVQITSMWYDTLDRLTTTAQYGTNHASSNSADFDRDGLSAPARSDTILVTSRVYNDNGTLLSVNDPKDIQTRYFYDDAHRQIHVISNYVNGTPSGPTGADDNFVRFTYDDGLRTEMWVDLDGDAVQDSDDQVTTYDYGVTTGSDPDLSLIDVNNLLYSTTYPDAYGGSSSDKVFYSYNAQGERIRTEDQIGDALEYTYDTAGRQTIVAATLAGGSPTDNAILRIETAYTNRGQVDTVSSYNAASSGTMVNQVDYTYDAWGNVTKIEQDRDAAGSGTSPYDIDFAYDEAGSGGLTSAFLRIHRTTVTYPNDDAMTFRFGSTAGSRGDGAYTSASLGRADQVSITPSGGSPVVQAKYEYLGLGHVVRTDYPVPDMWSAVTATSSAYPGLDRFNRIIESSWTWDYTTGTDYNAYEVDLTYDRNSNITWALDRWHAGRDVVYSMDGLNRLTAAQRGNESTGSITLENFHQEWTLGQTGNWDLFKNDLNGDNDWTDTNEVEDSRVHNEANELETRNTDNTGGVEHTLAYTAAGQLADDDQHYKYIYDAWGRLVKITNQADATITEYEYNGLGHRIGARWDIDADEDLDWEWFAYDDKWRIIARFGDSSAVDEPLEQIYHHHAGLAGLGGSSYIDLVIARDQFDYTEETPARTRDYVLQNWRADVVALAAPDGDLLERITYDAYGIPFATHPTDLTKGAIGGVAGYGMPDGTLNNDDYTYFLALFSGSNFRADWNRDGTLDAADNTVYLADKAAASGSWGRGVLSNRSSLLGYAGYVHEPATGAAGAGHGTMWHVRHRVLHSGLGRWIQRDPTGYHLGSSLLWYASARPTDGVDPLGLHDDPVHLAKGQFYPRPFRRQTMGEHIILDDSQLPWTLLGPWGVVNALTGTTHSIGCDEAAAFTWVFHGTTTTEEVALQSVLKHPSANSGIGQMRLREIENRTTYNVFGQQIPGTGSTWYGPASDVGWMFMVGCNTRYTELGHSYGQPVRVSALMAPSDTLTGENSAYKYYLQVMWVENTNRDGELTIDLHWGLAWWPKQLTVSGVSFEYKGVAGGVQLTSSAPAVSFTSGSVGSLNWTCTRDKPGPGGGS